MTENTFSTQTLSKDIKDFNSLDPQKKMIVAGIVLLLFLGSIFIGAYLSRGGSSSTTPPTTVNNPVNEAPNVPTKKPTTALQIDGQNAMKIGQTQNISVSLSNIPVTAADIVVSYDPDIFTVSNIKNGSVFPKVIQDKINTEEGLVVFSGSVDPSNPNNLQEGDVFSFTIKANKEAKSSLLQLERDETITAINGENTLGLTSGLSIKVTK